MCSNCENTVNVKLDVSGLDAAVEAFTRAQKAAALRDLVEAQKSGSTRDYAEVGKLVHAAITDLMADYNVRY